LSAEGLDVFRLAYDDAHRAILAQRKALEIGGATPANAAPVNVDNVTALPARAPG
jgi:hypothetical protein